jgi:hypothetical protein
MSLRLATAVASIALLASCGDDRPDGRAASPTPVPAAATESAQPRDRDDPMRGGLHDGVRNAGPAAPAGMTVIDTTPVADGSAVVLPSDPFRQDGRSTVQPDIQPMPAEPARMDADSVITERVREAVRADPAMSELAGGITVTTVRAVVTLQGGVASQAERDSIGRTAGQVAGVQRVENGLDVMQTIAAP